MQTAPSRLKLPSLRPCLHLGAGLAAARLSARLKRCESAAEQAHAFRRLTRWLSGTEHWGPAGIEPGMGYSQFQRWVRLHTYEDLAPAIERMTQGADSVLAPGLCHHYAASSGTTAGRTKRLPVNEAMLEHFRRAGLASLLFFSARVRHTRIFSGRHIFLGGSTALTPLPRHGNFQAQIGDLSALTALNLPKWVERYLYEPGQPIAQMTDWTAKIAAMAERSRTRHITAIAGIPSWILILAEAVLAGGRDATRAANLQQVWPDLQCIIHGGVPLGPFHDPLRSAVGPAARFHEVYPASEAFIAAQDAEPEAGLRLLTDAGIFFEFLPMAEHDRALGERSGARALPLSGVQTGVDYVLILTTPAGLGRYLIGDVVRFLSLEPPRLVYVGRTQLQLSAFGEHVIEKELSDALFVASHNRGRMVANFHVAPLFADNTSGRRRGRHEWWIEFRGSPGPAMELAALASELDTEVQRANEDYQAKRQGQALDPPAVRSVPPGTFERWLRRRGKWGGQNKMPRCRSDREIADELAELAADPAELTFPSRRA